MDGSQLTIYGTVSADNNNNNIIQLQLIPLSPTEDTWQQWLVVVVVKCTVNPSYVLLSQTGSTMVSVQCLSDRGLI